MTTPLSIYVLVDALGWDIVNRRPFLDDVLTDRRWLTTILGYSSGAIPTLLTGRPPAVHGHWNLFYLSPETSPFRWTRPLAKLPTRLVENRYTRHAVKLVSRRRSGYTGYFSIHSYPVAHLPLFDMTEKRDIYRPGGLDHPSLFDVLERQGISWEGYNYHRHTDDQILALAPERARRTDARVLFLYLSGLDHYLHFHVHDTPGVTAELARYEAGLRAVWKAATAARSDVRMFVFSDHGMTPIRWTYDLRRDVAALGLRSPDDYLAAYDSTMARFWVFDERARARLTTLLADHPCGQLLSRPELERLGIWFDDGRYYHLLFVAHPGLLLSPSDMGHVRFQGMHGYHPSEPTADAVLLSTVPVPRAVDHITGIHGALLEDLGITGSADGVPREASVRSTAAPGPGGESSAPPAARPVRRVNGRGVAA